MAAIASTQRQQSDSSDPAAELSSRSSSLTPRSDAPGPPAGALCRGLPSYCRHPPGTAVVFGFGVAEDGQLGVDTDQNLLYPKVVESLLGTRLRGRDFRSAPLVGGSRNTLAIDADGQLLAWGWNARGTLGHGHRTTERKPQYVTELRGVRIVQAAIGGWHCLAVSAKGQAYAFGGNEYGQSLPFPEGHQAGNAYGDAGSPENGSPHPGLDVVTPQPVLPNLKIVQVAAGGMHSVALTDTGEVWVWGEPWGDFSMQVNRRPRKVDISNIAKIACGAFHTLMLTWTGEVYTFGINDFGQLGNGTTSYSGTLPVKVVGLEDTPIADISAGGWHSLALTTTGAVYIWGRGEYGRLGLGDKTGSSKLRPQLVRSIQNEKVVQAVCGGTHTIVLTVEGRIFIWGRGSFGRLGTGVERDCYSPVSVSLPGGPGRWRVISLCAGGRHSLVLALPDSSAIDRPVAGGSLSDILRPLEISSPTAGGAAHGLGGQPDGLTPRSADATDELAPGEASDDVDDNKVGGSSDDESKPYGAQSAVEQGGDDSAALEGERARLGGADSPDGAYRDQMSSAQHHLIERALASHDMHNLVSDE